MSMTFDDYCQRNDYERKMRDQEPDSRSDEQIEQNIRRRARETVAHWVKTLPRGNRGAGKTPPIFLAEIRFARRNHTESIRRSRLRRA